MSGSGIILYTKRLGKIQYLGLEVDKKFRKKHKGKWDLPKGTAEPGESSLDCAIRETYEETNISITPDQVSNEYLVIGKLTMYFAETDQNPVLKPNPTSGIIEHINYQWLEGSDMYKDCFIWLKPFIKWIRNKQL